MANARRLGAVLLGLAAAPAAAQNGAMWVDQYGRMMSMEFAGGSGSAPAPADLAPAEMASRFKTLCLGSGVAAAAAQAGLAATPISLPAGKKAPPVSFGIWRGPGVVVSQSDGAAVTGAAQCNVTYYVNALPERQAVADALAAVLGSAPSNAAEAADKKGRPRKFYSPEWKIGPATDARIVTAFVQKGDRSMPGSRVQISVRAEKRTGK